MKGEFRTRDLEIIAGDDKTETEYKESGCRFIVDVRKAFFSPRLSSERMRISELVNDGEVIVNMFGGIGMFSIIAAKRKNVPYTTLISIRMPQILPKKYCDKQTCRKRNINSW